MPTLGEIIINCLNKEYNTELPQELIYPLITKMHIVYNHKDQSISLTAQAKEEINKFILGTVE